MVNLERFDHSPLAVLLLRRGGYAVALAAEDGLLAHKVGSRHVQSRTAAGGWSQQRFARRRGNQADALVGAVQDHFVRILDGQPAPMALLVGGDKALAAEVLADPRLVHPDHVAQPRGIRHRGPESVRVGRNPPAQPEGSSRSIE